MLGGGGLVAVNVYASATEDSRTLQTPWGAVTVSCPDVGDALTDVPDESRADVDKELAFLDQQVAEAYQRLQDPSVGSREAAQSQIVDPLQENRAATIGRISAALQRAGANQDGLDSMAACEMRESADDGGGQNGDQGGQDQQGQQDGQDQGNGQDQGDGQNGDQQGDGQDQGGQDQDGQQGNGGQAGNGPVAADYADITSVQPSGQTPDPSNGPSRGTFVTSCGVNANGLFNSDNVIVAPGVSNGAHHFHDYIGNQSNTAFASDQDLANAQTSCVDQGDKSTYYWPVLRLQNGTQEQDANSPGGGIEGNAGEIVTAKEVTLTFVGNPRSKVTEMPRLLRIITGDAKAFVNGTANANASWSCTGFEDRQLKDKYPLCPSGSDVVRTFRFQSCWDGANIDSANHRTHVAFAGADGSCPQGFEAIPQLVQRIVYDVDAPSLADGGGTTPLFAVDSFPEQLHKPVTDHGDFINVFDEGLMRQMVDCINEGRTCGAGTGDNGSGDNGNGGNGGNDNGGNGNGGGNNGGDDNGGNDNGGGTDQPPADDQPTPPVTSAPPADDQSTAPADNGNGNGNGSGNDEPKTYTSPSAKPTADSTVDPSAAADVPSGTQDDNAANDDELGTTEVIAQPPAVGAQTQPQGGQESLAETGAQLWPAAAGSVLLIAGFVLLRRTRRRPM